MSFYGNISNAGKTQMSFDRVYPNRKIMEENAPTDGVFVGRFVLVEYDDLIKFKFIIVELSKIKYDIRYCEKRKCRCHPESSIEYILKDASDNLIEFLKKENIYEALKELIESYEVKISKYVYDIYLK